MAVVYSLAQLVSCIIVSGANVGIFLPTVKSTLLAIFLAIIGISFCLSFFFRR